MLDDALAQPRAVRADTDRPARDVREGDCALVGPARRSGNLTAALQALDTLPAAHVCEREANLTRLAIHDPVCKHPPVRAEHLVVILREVEVLKPAAGFRGIHPCYLKRSLDRLIQADPGAAVAADVNAGEALSDGEVKRRPIHRIFPRGERTRHVSDVIRHEDDIATVLVLLRHQCRPPAYHADVVHTRRALNLHQVAALAVTRHDKLVRRTRGKLQHELHQALDPRLGRILVVPALLSQDVCENLREVVCVGAVEVLADHPLALDGVQERVKRGPGRRNQRVVHG